MNPAFPQADFERVQDQRLVTLAPAARSAAAPSPRRRSSRCSGASTRTATTLLGDEAAVKATRPRGPRAASTRASTARERAELVVVGDVSEAELRPLLEATLGAWKRGAAAPRPLLAKPPRRAAPDGPRREAGRAAGVPARSACPAFERSAPDYVAASVAFQVLGGGSSSRLFRNLREEKGYTYGVYAMGDARKLARREPRRREREGRRHRRRAEGDPRASSRGCASEPVPARGARRTRRTRSCSSLPADFATAGGIAGRVAELALHGLPDDYWNGYADEVRKVDAEAVRRVAERYLDPARMTVVMVGEPGGRCGRSSPACRSGHRGAARRRLPTRERSARAARPARR